MKSFEELALLLCLVMVTTFGGFAFGFYVHMEIAKSHNAGRYVLDGNDNKVFRWNDEIEEQEQTNERD